MNWFLYALLATFFFSGMTLLFKKVLASGITPAALMLFFTPFFMLFYILHAFVTKTPTTISKPVVLLIIAAAFLSYIANLLFTKSIAVAPNAGYPTAIIGLQLAIITLGSVMLFGSTISPLKGVGIALAIVAGMLLAL